MSSISSFQPLDIMPVTWPVIRGTENTLALALYADQNWVPHTKEQGEDWVCNSLINVLFSCLDMDNGNMISTELQCDK